MGDALMGGELRAPADPAAIHAARDALRRTLAIGLREELSG